jgi:hypothetical protein
MDGPQLQVNHLLLVTAQLNVFSLLPFLPACQLEFHNLETLELKVVWMSEKKNERIK